mgnify:CR=1 FL=1|tara:strand:- start:201 stop:947 length:747 start_codon:yes stop_codon:yes gene_type:complete
MTGKKIKIALCLSGEPRSSMFCFPYIYEAFMSSSKYFKAEVDVYIHSWRKFRALEIYNPKSYNIELPEEFTHPEQILSDLTLPNSLSSNKVFNDGFTSQTNVFLNSTKMLTSIKQSFDLVKQPYDIYIRSRFDLIFTNKFFIRPIVEDILNGKYDMFIPLKYPWPSDGIEYNDQLAIGNYKSMNIYSNTVTNLQHLLNITEAWGPEIFLRQQLNDNNIKINEFFINHRIVRKSDVIVNESGYYQFLDE